MASSNRPGVIVRQTTSSSSSSVASPTLVPLLIGPCFQIVDLLDDSGDFSADALYGGGQYNQAALLIPEADLPDPRSNIDELVFQDSTISAAFSFGGKKVTLHRGSQETYGTSFLKGLNLARRAAWRSTLADSFSFTSSTKTLTMAVDVVNPSDTTKDLTVTFSEGSLTTAQVVTAINAVFPDLAESVTLNGDNYIQFASETYGAASSITLRSCSALQVLFGMSSGQSASEYRIEGAGFRGQDDEDGDLLTPWVEFYVGAFLVDDEAGSWPTTSVDDPPDAGNIWVGFMVFDEAAPSADDTFIAALASAVTFAGSSPTAPLTAATSTVPGDQFWVNGGRVSTNTEVIKAEETRFKLGKISTSLSTYDDDGVATDRVYTTYEVNTIYSSTPLAPKYAYFIADGLVYGEVDPEGTAATLTGNLVGLVARAAIVQSSYPGTSAFPTNMGGLTLIYQMTVDGVQGDETTYTFPGDEYTLTDVATALSGEFGDGYVVSVATVVGDNGRLVITSAKTGADQEISIKSTGTANAILLFSEDAATDDSGKDVELAAQAQVAGTALDFSSPPFVQGSTNYDIIIVDSKGTHSLSYTFGISVDSISELIDAICDAFGSTDSDDDTIYDGGIPVAVVTSDGNALVITSIEGGAAVQIDIDETSGWSALGFSSSNDDGVGGDLLKGTSLGFSLDNGAQTYEFTFTTNSLSDAADLINEGIAGSADVATVSSGSLVLTSMLAGAASAVDVDSSGDYDASAILGFDVDNDSAVGSGRPNPDFYVDDDGSVNIGPSILRGKTTGVPFRLSSALANLYIGYKALRLDVTASAETPGTLSFENVSDMEDAIGPISEENPLALACYLAMLNLTNVSITVLGVDEVNDAAPMGTIDGWMRALEFVEGKEVFAIAPITDDEYVQSLVAEHVEAMSEPAERGERCVFIWSAVPSREATTTVASGTGETNGTPNSFTLGENAEAEIAALGLDANALAADDAVYLEILVSVSGVNELRRYSVSEVNGSVVNVRVAFDDGENDDSFYSTDTLSEELTDQEWALKIRGDELLITGTTRPDNSGIATAAATQGSGFAHKRVQYLFFESMDVSIDGQTANIAGYYMSAIYAAMAAQLPPQQPFSNVPVVGCSKVYGTTDRFTESQMDTIADGGRWIVINFGGKVMARHARSTAVTSVEEMEFSILKSVDWFSKGLRGVNRVFIGRNVITPGFLDQLSICNDGFCSYAVQVGVVGKATVDKILQDSDVPTKVNIDVSIDPVYPCNTIDITVVS